MRDEKNETKDVSRKCSLNDETRTIIPGKQITTKVLLVFERVVVSPDVPFASRLHASLPALRRLRDGVIRAPARTPLRVAGPPGPLAPRARSPLATTLATLLLPSPRPRAR